MSPSYSLVLTSIICSLVLGFAIIFYRFVFPKKNISPLVLLILISFLPLVSLLRPGSYESSDLSFHIQEAMSFYKFLNQGELFPVWGGDMNFGYGYPAFQYTYPLPFYAIVATHVLGFSFTDSTKIVLALAYLLSGVCMYLFLKNEFGKKAAFVGALIYQFAPYHLIDLHFRAAIGEIFAFVFIPLILLAAQQFIAKKQLRWFVIESFSVAFLIMSHPAISMSGLPVISLYIVILIWRTSKKFKNSIFQICSLVFGVLLSAIYWLPVISEIRYTLKPINALQFVNFSDLFYSPFRYGLLFQGSYGELVFLLGYAQLLVILVGIYILIKKKILSLEKLFLICSLFVVIIFSFMMVTISKPVWESIALIQNFQFTYRLHGAVMLSIAIIAALVTKYFNNRKFIIALCLLIVFSTILNWGNRKNLPDLTDKALAKKIPSAAYYGGGINQGITVWSDREFPYAKTFPKQPMEIIRGEGRIKNITRLNSQHTYEVYAESDLLVKENTLYFPGWRVFIDGKEQEILINSDQLPYGIISFHIPKGEHTVNVIFQDTKARANGKAVSVAAFFGILTVIVSSYFLRKKKLRK